MTTTPQPGTANSDAVSHGLADPLQPAIEAALNAAYEFAGHLGLDEDDQTDFELGVGAAVRAAAPHIERAALLRMAREILAEGQAHAAKWDTGWDRGFAAGMEHAAHDIANKVQRDDQARDRAETVGTEERG